MSEQDEDLVFLASLFRTADDRHMKRHTLL